jgi:Mlc titration factor MtfA (ptsG expression regulator)
MSAMFEWLKRHRHARILETPFPEAWAAILEANLPSYARLDDADRKTLRDKTQIFLAEKRFEGCGGLELDDEIRVTIAGQACLLLLHLDEEDVFPSVQTILVYPSAYKVPPRPHLRGGVVIEQESARLGEAWGWGTIVLAWDAVLRGAHAPDDGHNLVVHEFAHALDWEDGAGDGAPVLPRRAMYGPWAKVLGTEYEELLRASEEGERSLLDAYGATNPAEFFAVASEVFFERPERMKREHPALYEQLAAFYRQDPASRGA